MKCPKIYHEYNIGILVFISLKQFNGILLLISMIKSNCKGVNWNLYLIANTWQIFAFSHAFDCIHPAFDIINQISLN